MRKLFSILIFFSLYCTVFSAPPLDSVRQIAAAIAKRNVYESAIVGFAGTASTQNERLNKLIKIATDKELFALTTHENPVVRLYALRAIISRKLFVSPALRNKFYTDKSKVVTLQGCIGDNSSVGVLSRAML